NPIDPETGERRALTRFEEMQEEARTNPIWFPDGSSTQEILPIEEQWHPKDKYGKDEGDYIDETPVSAEHAAITEALLQKMRLELGDIYDPHWVGPTETDHKKSIK
ncbi:MAG: hypothetical protein ABIY70_17610, partial [Capsulimonas sp.]|uniref:hypothetical protein n=1 Tax=Capsulimonas sp. TaxID=2494211 RepID=UPI003262F963